MSEPIVTHKKENQPMSKTFTAEATCKPTAGALRDALAGIPDDAEVDHEISTDRLHELAAIAEAAHDIAPARPGTGWHWAGNTSNTGHISLSAWVSGHGRCSVMAFWRWGMGGAQPSFIGRDVIMRPAVEFVQYEVGNPSIVGRQNRDHSVYREDISGIAHPIAAHIAAFDPTTARALIAEVLTLREQRDKVLALADDLAREAAELSAGDGDYRRGLADSAADAAARARRALGVTEEADR